MPGTNAAFGGPAVSLGALSTKTYNPLDHFPGIIMITRTKILASAAMLLALWYYTAAVSTAQDGGLCATAGNLAKNCNFDGYGGQPGIGSVANNWRGFKISGNPEFLRSDHSPEPFCQQIWSDGGLWEAGVYQTIGVTPGQGYRAEVGWFTPFVENGANVGRIGIDPDGGTDPGSARIAWSTWTKLNKSTHHQVKASASGGSVTVFVVAKFQQNTGTNLAWIDAVILVPDGSAPPPPAPPAPPTNTPAPVPPTNTPRPTATRTPTRVPPTRTPVPTDTLTPVPSPTAAPTLIVQAATETPTPTSTAVPSVTATRRPTLTSTPAPDLLTANLDVIGLGLVSLSACALFAAATLAITAYWYWHRK